MREKWAGTNLHLARLATLVSLALARFAHENAVTATRRPKDTRVTLRPNGLAGVTAILKSWERDSKPAFMPE